ncbi:MAG: cytochrome c biogenesis protein CcdA [Pseudomonadota bacterium]|nr:cytochrome c biogenesis protein CcdA [Pseudomonadota bacterium]
MDEFGFSLGAAFLGGLLSFLSPCVLPLVPGYLCFAAGIGFEELTEADENVIWGRILPGALAFVAGFSVVFISLGAGAAAINPFILGHKDLLAKIAGVFIVILGLHMAGIFRISFLQRELRVTKPVNSGEYTGENQLLTAFGLGLAFAFGWTPCIGPILATILTLAASSDSLPQGVGLLATYAAGLGVPFVLSAVGVGYFLQSSPKIKQRLGLLEKITGGLLITTGILIFSGSLQNLATYLLDWFPALSKLG